MTDKVNDIKKVNDNLYLVNFNNKVVKNIVINEVTQLDKNKYIQIYSTDYRMSIKELKGYIKERI